MTEWESGAANKFFHREPRPRWIKGWVLDDATRQWERVYEHEGHYRARLGPTVAPRIDHLIDQQYREAGFTDTQIEELNRFTEERVEVILAERRVRDRLRNPKTKPERKGT